MKDVTFNLFSTRNVLPSINLSHETFYFLFAWDMKYLHLSH